MMLIRGCRPVPLPGQPLSAETVDIRIKEDTILEVAPLLMATSEDEIIDAHGRWVMPGLWDAHVHMTQWALGRFRMDLSAATSLDHALRILTVYLDRGDGGNDSKGASSGPLLGYGHRSAAWSQQPTTSALDRACGTRPVILISGDAHHAWMNSTAMELLGLTHREEVVAEREWFEVFPRLNSLLGTAQRRKAIDLAVREAASRGVVGIGEMEFAPSYAEWPQWVSEGIDQLRVRTAVYPDRVDEVITAGWRSGDALDRTGLVTMGPLKIIYDGSLNTRTAWTTTPYGSPPSCGVRNHTISELRAMVQIAVDVGLDVAIHALGDAALAEALDAFAATGATGSIEHVQLLNPVDARLIAGLDITASVQPAHLLDDAAVTDRVWPDRADRCFAVRTLADAGVRLALGSDAPVAALDPWLSMAAAVWREDVLKGPDAAPWHQEQAISPIAALAASVNGRRIAPGGPADLILLDDDPAPRELSSPWEQASRLRRPHVTLTVCAGRVSHRDL